jgi:ABC-type nitrate/sulfonate/bicarbonate transport system substrate-binding protein
MTPDEPVELTLGFIPLLDSALPIIAAEKGFAEAEGLRLRLVRETSWANIRDRLSLGHFDAAHMLGPMVVSQALGLGPLAEPLLAPVALGRGGNAITVSLPLWERLRAQGAGADDPPAAMGAALARVVVERDQAGLAPLTLAMVFPFSCHNYQLRDWLATAGLDPDRDVRLVVLPPPLLVDALRSGQIDGFCVGEPWNSLAVSAGIGALIVAVSDLMPQAPEKVLGVRARFAQEHPGRVAALIRAIEASSQWAARPEHHAELASLLSQPRFVGVPAELMQQALAGRVRTLPGKPPRERAGFMQLSGEEVTAPLTAHADWYYRQMQRWGQVAQGDALRAIALASFRPDLRAAALGSRAPLPVKGLES